MGKSPISRDAFGGAFFSSNKGHFGVSKCARRHLQPDVVCRTALNPYAHWLGERVQKGRLIRGEFEDSSDSGGVSPTAVFLRDSFGDISLYLVR